MTYPQAIQFLYDLQMFGTKLGLENTFQLAALAGSPQEKLRFIHVAGTNGKGSTCAILESIYRAAGLRVGLFTSPHLVSFAERIQVNRQLISEPEAVRLVSEMRTLLEHFPREGHPTFFEVVTVMALKYFAEQKCDLVIWETGIGGRLDATNIVTPLASVITNVQLDHQKWLGDSIEQIASEKAGIIKAGIPVVTGENKPAVLQVIESAAIEKKAPLTIVQPQDEQYRFLRNVELPLLGEHQRSNAALAVTTVKLLEQTHPVDNQSIETGLKTVFWPGRLQQVQTGSGQRIFLDGAHNPAGAEALRNTLRQQFGGEKTSLVLGILRDKQFGDICEILAPLSDRIFLVPVGSERTAAPEELQAICRTANPAARIRSCRSIAQAIEETKADPFVVITGSLYLIGEAMELLGISSAKNERGLNEWNANPKSSRS